MFTGWGLMWLEGTDISKECNAFIFRAKQSRKKSHTRKYGLII
jgi:hypothetical protein